MKRARSKQNGTLRHRVWVGPSTVNNLLILVTPASRSLHYNNRQKVTTKQLIITHRNKVQQRLVLAPGLIAAVQRHFAAGNLGGRLVVSQRPWGTGTHVGISFSWVPQLYTREKGNVESGCSSFLMSVVVSNVLTTCRSWHSAATRRGASNGIACRRGLCNYCRPVFLRASSSPIATLS